MSNDGAQMVERLEPVLAYEFVEFNALYIL
jgi:hypothetical protein